MSEAVEPGRLYVVSTPIGNMGDFSFRAVETLRAVSLVLAEDTRHSRPLLDRYEIRTPLQAYHEHNEAKATPGIIQAYRGLVADLVQRLVAAGSEGAPAVAEHARLELLERFGCLASFKVSGRPGRDPVCDTATLSLAVATWVAEILWSSAGADDLPPERLLAELTRERRHMYQSAGLFDALPWKVTW